MDFRQMAVVQDGREWTVFSGTVGESKSFRETAWKSVCTIVQKDGSGVSVTAVSDTTQMDVEKAEP